MMKYEQIKYELENSATIKLLRSRNAALVLSFLHQQFKVTQTVSITQIELETKLGNFLEYLQNDDRESYPRSPKEYLSDWCDDRLLRKTFNSNDEALFTLAPAAEKAIGWIEDLQQRDEFIGTESRFLQIFALLKEIQDRSTTDVETRIAQLEQERDNVQTQIDRIRVTGEVDLYSQTQLQERFILADKLARQLIADFGDIEQNFRDLTLKVQAAQLEKDSRKGTVLGQVLDADAELKESPQGRSFYAFWSFLVSENKRQELKSTIQNVYQLEELQPLVQDYAVLRRIERSLLDAGEHIFQSNRRLSEKLRQMLDERNLQQNRRIAELINDVQRIALQVANNPPTESDFWIVEGEPAIYLPMARPLHPLEASEVPTFALNFTDLPESVPEAEIAELYQQFYVDEDDLIQQIDQTLEQRSTIGLTDLIQLYPITQGLSEVLAYVTIADRLDRHSIDTSIIELITIPSLEAGIDLKLQLPQIIFRR
jgi:Protein of unknown function (DUF3375)